MNRLSYDPDNVDDHVKIEPLISIVLPNKDWYEDVFVFDGAVAVRVNNTAFQFFMMPIVKSL